MKLLALLSLTFLLHACVVHPVATKGKVVVKKPVKAMTKLDRQHHQKNIIILTRTPHVEGKCWGHQQHWHCYRE